jgi:DNA ligase-1
MKGLAEIWEFLETLPFHRDREPPLAEYFRGLMDSDLKRVSAWLVGDEKLPALVPGATLLELAASASGLPRWLLEECATHVDSAGEAIALAMPEPPTPADWDWEADHLSREVLFAHAWSSPTLIARKLAFRRLAGELTPPLSRKALQRALELCGRSTQLTLF